LRKIIISAVVIASMSCSSLFAHHGRGVGFDAAHPLTLTGTVTKLHWINPHVFVFFDVTDENGHVKNWGIEWSTPRSLLISGMNRDTMKPGTVVKFRFIPAASGAPRGEIEQAWNAEGKLLFDRNIIWPAGYPSK
jgi:hypothetical protein